MTRLDEKQFHFPAFVFYIYCMVAKFFLILYLKTAGKIALGKICFNFYVTKQNSNHPKQNTYKTMRGL